MAQDAIKTVLNCVSLTLHLAGTSFSGFHLEYQPLQKEMHMLFEHIEGVDTTMDDIIVWSSTKAEHDDRLRDVFETTKKANSKLNRSKREFGVKKLVFIGDVLTEHGVQPSELKISAIVNMPRPGSKVDVQRFLGMVN